MGRGKKQLVSFVWNVGLKDRRALGNRVKMSSGPQCSDLEGLAEELGLICYAKETFKTFGPKDCNIVVRN